MFMTTLKNLTIYLDNKIIENGYVVFNEHIVDIGQGDVEGIDMEGKIMIPGFIDQHTHGVSGFGVMDASFQALDVMTSTFPSEGTTSFLATTMTDDVNQIQKALSTIDHYIKKNHKPGAQIIGVHLEGPFISKKYKGAQDENFILAPSISLFDSFNQNSGSIIKQITLAPELPGAYALISHLKSKGIQSSIGHSDASFEEVKKAIQCGASCFTHGYNAMGRMHHRDLGVVGAMLLSDTTYVELICDLVHTSKEAIALLYKNISSDKIILVTDAIKPKSLSDGQYQVGHETVIKQGSKAILSDGTLAGSLLRMDDAVKTFKKITECSLRDIINVSSRNAAISLGVFDSKGSIAVGKDADFIVIDSDLNLYETYCRGIRCF